LEVGKLLPRDAFYGGRTNNTRLYKKADIEFNVGKNEYN
jgi:hypothetical protein